MLSEEEKKEIEEIAGHYPKRRAACIEALRVVQQHRGWVSDESLAALAEFLDMSTHELDSVATFYNLVYRKPVGRHVILVCDSISCWVKGYEKIAGHLSEKLGVNWGETTEDDRFTLLPICCLGTCDHAPAMMVDEDLHRDLTTEQVEAIIQNYE